ncbi:unnamed protein product [Ixodes persulcatus]
MYDTAPAGNSGGICEKFQLGASVELASEYAGRLSLNTGIVTFINQNVQVPQRITEITFSHEMGHNFGSPHDFPAECTPANGDGKYIMYASATQGTLPNNRKFSPCSVRNISLVLEQVFMTDGHRTNCFQELRGPFCGNSIRDGNEECDCGYEPGDCEDSCCYSRGNAGKSCKLKSHAVCR